MRKPQAQLGTGFSVTTRLGLRINAQDVNRRMQISPFGVIFSGQISNLHLWDTSNMRYLKIKPLYKILPLRRRKIPIIATLQN
jgi:hypothetical protein